MPTSPYRECRRCRPGGGLGPHTLMENLPSRVRPTPSAEPSRLRARRVPALLVVGISLLACGHGQKREFIWAGEVPDAIARSNGEYRIVEGDVLAIRVWQQDTMSADRVRVREDGKISVPFLQDVEVAGVSPTALSARLKARLTS